MNTFQMADSEKVDLDMMCRTCLTKEGVTHELSEEEKIDGERIRLIDILVSCTELKIKPDDPFPKKICEKCVAHLSAAYIFNKNSVHAQRILVELVKHNRKLVRARLKKKSSKSIIKKITIARNTKQSILKKDLNSKNTSAEKAKTDKEPPNLIREVKILPKTPEIQQKKQIEIFDVFKNPNVLIGNQNLPILRKIPTLIAAPDVTFNGIPKENVVLHHCTKCTKKFISATHLQNHIEKFHQELRAITDCSICNVRYNTPEDLTTHNLEIHFPSSNRSICDLCHKEFSNKYLMIRHKRKFHAPSSMDLCCEGCGQLFSSMTGLALHQKQFCPVPRGAEQCFRCKYCARGYASEGSLADHAREHAGQERPHSCIYCPKQFSARKVLLRHQRSRHGAAREVLLCGHCQSKSFGFLTTEHLQEHMMKEHQNIIQKSDAAINNEKPYVITYYAVGESNTGMEVKYDTSAVWVENVMCVDAEPTLEGSGWVKEEIWERDGSGDEEDSGQPVESEERVVSDVQSVSEEEITYREDEMSQVDSGKREIGERKESNNKSVIRRETDGGELVIDRYNRRLGKGKDAENEVSLVDRDMNNEDFASNGEANDREVERIKEESIEKNDTDSRTTGDEMTASSESTKQCNENRDSADGRKESEERMNDTATGELEKKNPQQAGRPDASVAIEVDPRTGLVTCTDRCGRVVNRAATPDREQLHKISGFIREDIDSVNKTSAGRNKGVETSPTASLEESQDGKRSNPVHTCQICSKTFLRLVNLEKHVSQHTDDNASTGAHVQRRRPNVGEDNSGSPEAQRSIQVKTAQRLVCPTCGKRLTTVSGLRYHVQTHSAVRRHACPVCGRRFLTPAGLRTHARTVHSAVRPHPCSQCCRRFASADHLRKHAKSVHHKSREHLCRVCGKTFLQSSHVRQHMWLHTGIKPHACPHCPNHYTASCSLAKHLRRNHWEQQNEKRLAEEEMYRKLLEEEDGTSKDASNVNRSIVRPKSSQSKQQKHKKPPTDHEYDSRTQILSVEDDEDNNMQGSMLAINDSGGLMTVNGDIVTIDGHTVTINGNVVTIDEGDVLTFNGDKVISDGTMVIEGYEDEDLSDGVKVVIVSEDVMGEDVLGEWGKIESS